MFKSRQFNQSVILLCVRWYLACNLSLRDLEEIMAERGIAVDHTPAGAAVADSGIACQLSSGVIIH